MNLNIRNQFIIRRYRERDFEGIKRLWNETGMNDPERADNEKTILATLKTGGSLLVMIEKESGTVCGTSWMSFDGRRIHLHHFGILPPFQGKGLSGILLDESLKFVREKGCQVKLEVKQNNAKAISLYKKAGFTCLGDYDVYIIRDIPKID
ncbi:MAG: GNAT family N-acetyltransferase [Bacteroidales bacterium]|jgi:ribosomal protein S18 acetylase RimI-like enzyme